MIRFSINLPTKRRLEVNVTKRRKSFDEKPLLPDMGKVARVKKGSKISRVFRHVFEHKNIKKLLGANFAVMLAVSTFLPQNNNDLLDSPEAVTNSPIILTTERSIRYPLDEVKITQGYRFYHPGIDFDGVYGEAVNPIMNGKIEAVDYSTVGYGNAILINHGGEITSLYAHLAKIFVVEDEDVTTSSIIGSVGTSGWASGDHLHLEVRSNGYPFNPSVILPN